MSQTFPPIEEFPSRPGVLLRQWLADAKASNIPLPSVASVATSDPMTHRISNRILNFITVEEDSLTVYSDFKNSRKGRDLHANNHVAVTFYWKELRRSIRVEGRVSFMSSEESEPYFKSREREFQASVLLGTQDRPIETRHEMETKMKELLSQPESKLRIPDFWYGAKVVPDMIEFWQGNNDRISDRIEYTLKDGKWHGQRVSP